MSYTIQWHHAYPVLYLEVLVAIAHHYIYNVLSKPFDISPSYVGYQAMRCYIFHDELLLCLTNKLRF